MSKVSIISRLGNSMKRQDCDMTVGDINRHIVTFAIPLLIGNIFQQLYNTVDTWVVGNYVSNDAFAAVGSVSPIINMLIGFFMGLSSGAGVVISQFYGAKQEEQVKKTVHTAILMTLILAIVFTAVGIFITPFMLRFMKTADSVFPESKAYLTIYFSGVVGLMVYNIGSGILRAVGDSRRPFYFLVVSAVTNTVLDLVFVLIFDMGVAGVAYATIIAQGLSAILVIITLVRSKSCIRLSLSNLKISWDMLAKIFFVAFRQVYLFIMANYISNTLIPIAMGYPAGWILCSILTSIYYHKADLSKTSVVK